MMSLGKRAQTKDMDTVNASAAGQMVVVGNGMVGHRFCSSLRALDSSTPVVVLSGENEPAYDRVNLTRLVANPDPLAA